MSSLTKESSTLKNIPTGYQNILVHTVFDIKHDVRHHARVVTDGHLTEVLAESV